MTAASQPQGRAREHPRQRFAGIERLFNLDQAFSQLPAESTIHQGHMQKALYRLGPTTTAIFQFEKNGRIDQHTAAGEAIIHVLAGRLQVRTAAASHELKANDLLLLDPGVPHDLRAIESTRMLLTFVREES